MRLLASYLPKAADLGETAIICINALYDLVGKSNGCSSGNMMGEDSYLVQDSFTHANLVTYLDHIFARTSKFKITVTSSMLVALQNSNDSILMEQFSSDLAASVVILGKIFDLFVVEIKKPCSDNTGSYSDLVKLGKELKVMVDHLVKNGVAIPVVCGLLCAGSYSDKTFNKCQS